MILLATLDQGLLSDGQIVYLADPGSNTPHSIMIDGVIEELIDPPTFKFTAGLTPLPLSDSDFV